jgi:hypothetical protein
MNSVPQGGRGKKASFLPLPAPLPKAVGYSVMRSGDGIAAEVCLLVPHVNPMKSLAFDPIAKRLDADVSGARIALTELPADVAALLAREPQRVLLVSVDDLSRARFSARASDLM